MTIVDHRPQSHLQQVVGFEIKGSLRSRLAAFGEQIVDTVTKRVAPKLAVRAAAPAEVVVHTDEGADHVDPSVGERDHQLGNILGMAPPQVLESLAAIKIHQDARGPTIQLVIGTHTFSQ